MNNWLNKISENGFDIFARVVSIFLAGTLIVSEVPVAFALAGEDAGLAEPFIEEEELLYENGSYSDDDNAAFKENGFSVSENILSALGLDEAEDEAATGEDPGRKNIDYKTSPGKEGTLDVTLWKHQYAVGDTFDVSDLCFAWDYDTYLMDKDRTPFIDRVRVISYSDVTNNLTNGYSIEGLSNGYKFTKPGAYTFWAYYNKGKAYNASRREEKVQMTAIVIDESLAHGGDHVGTLVSQDEADIHLLADSVEDRWEMRRIVAVNSVGQYAVGGSVDISTVTAFPVYSECRNRNTLHIGEALPKDHLHVYPQVFDTEYEHFPYSVEYWRSSYQGKTALSKSTILFADILPEGTSLHSLDAETEDVVTNDSLIDETEYDPPVSAAGEYTSSDIKELMVPEMSSYTLDDGAGELKDISTARAKCKVVFLDDKGNRVSSANYCYTGQQVCPRIAVSVKDELTRKYVQLTQGTDYSVSYGENLSPSRKTKKGWKKDATITIVGTGAYTGTVTVNFAIRKASVKLATIGLRESGSTGEYRTAGVSIPRKGATCGNDILKLGTNFKKSFPVEPDVQVTYNGILLTRGTDYTVSYNPKRKGYSNRRVGKACVRIKGTGTYFSGVTYADYTIAEGLTGAEQIAQKIFDENPSMKKAVASYAKKKSKKKPKGVIAFENAFMEEAKVSDLDTPVGANSLAGCTYAFYRKGKNELMPKYDGRVYVEYNYGTWGGKYPSAYASLYSDLDCELIVRDSEGNHLTLGTDYEYDSWRTIRGIGDYYGVVDISSVAPFTGRQFYGAEGKYNRGCNTSLLSTYWVGEPTTTKWLTLFGVNLLYENYYEYFGKEWYAATNNERLNGYNYLRKEDGYFDYPMAANNATSAGSLSDPYPWTVSGHYYTN